LTVATLPNVLRIFSMRHRFDGSFRNGAILRRTMSAFWCDAETYQPNRSVIPSRKWLDRHYPASFVDNWLRSAVNPDSREYRLSVFPKTDVDKTFAVD
jgi:hypothetical protein